MLADADPFSAGIFPDLWWGSQIFDDSRRNGFTWDVGVIASLTALSNVTISGRLYAEIYSDRHCPTLKTTGTMEFDGDDPLAICEQYRDRVNGNTGALSDEDFAKTNLLTTGSETEQWEFDERESGIRLMMSIVAEVAIQQRWSIFGILEGAPFNGERALFTYDFAHSMPDSDLLLYLRLGTTYKF
jgi:hypothetical protein